MSWKKIMIYTVVLFLLFPVVSTAKADAGTIKTKDEVIYATLDALGNQEGMYVVNRFDMGEQGSVVDYGNYTEVKNLSNLNEIELDGDKIQFEATEDEFYYQGQLDQLSLPWDITIEYLLNGEIIEPKELIGQDGALEIRLTTKENKDSKETFYNNYLLQISFTLQPSVFENIVAENATIANAGKNKQVAFTVMPENDGEFSIKADVTDFEMDGIDITAVPSSMSIDAPNVDEMTDELGTLSSAINDVHKGVGEFQSGINELNDGLGALLGGSNEFKNGMTELNQSSDQLRAASSSIQDALVQLNQALSGEAGSVDLSQLVQLPKGLNQISSGLTETAEGLKTLDEKYSQAYDALTNAIHLIPDTKLTEEEMQALKESDVDEKVVQQLLETYEAAYMVKGTYQQVKPAFDAVKTNLPSVNQALVDMADGLATTSDNIANAIDSMDITKSMAELQEGISALATNYQSFHKGLEEYVDGLSQLTTGYTDIHQGLDELDNGVAQLADGARELHDGTGELANQTADLPEQMKDGIDEMIAEYDKSDFEAQSFVSDKNEQIGTVQFVITTKALNKEESDEEEQEKEEEKGIWERFLDLFR
jgi:putative membrane protein